MTELMKELFGKFTRYDWFTTLLPGLFFVSLAEKFGAMNMEANSLLEKCGLIFFCGLVSSRIGASVVEPVFKIKRFKLWGEYGDYMSFREKDPKGADMLVTNSNWFRSLIGMVLLLGVSYFFNCFCLKFDIASVWKRCAILVCLLFLFGDSYRRQLVFIQGRIRHYRENK